MLTMLTGGRGLRAQDSTALAPFAFLEGTWLGEGQWPDGSRMKAEVRYFWGPTRRLLHFETWNHETGQRTLLYEGMIFFDQARGRVVQWNVKPDGEVDVSEYAGVSPGRFEVQAARTRSVVRQTGADEFHWELRVPKDDDWQLILDATYRRVKGEWPESAAPTLGAGSSDSRSPPS